ncbi:MAG: four helix bundle protein [Verrucomicrobiae bacterium]|nr:four helix bundle protein [Verrucomicrobiae bacterium]NNJ85922.1 four helix bundle protein [Akkermansiaceae bacterium]
MNDQINIVDRAFNFAVRITKLSQALDQSAGTNRTLANQLLRSGTSIGANVEEAQAAQSRKDFISKMSISSKEARETLYWLRILIASGIMSEQKLSPLKAEANEMVAIITTIVKNAQENLVNQ